MGAVFFYFPIQALGFALFIIGKLTATRVLQQKLM